MQTLQPFVLATTMAGLLIPTIIAADNEKKDSTEHYVSVGEVEVVLKSASSTSSTLQTNQITALNSGRGRGGGTKVTPKDQVIEFTSDLKVRVIHLPPVFDKDGKPTVRSPEELDKLNGNSTLPGYVAEVSDLKANQTVKISVVKPKNSAAADANKLYVKRIIIEKDPAGSKTADKKPEEKKKT
jgi:hypothetical protein